MLDGEAAEAIFVDGDSEAVAGHGVPTSSQCES